MSWKPPQAPLDPPSTWRWRRRQLRNLAIVCLILIGLGHAVGVPHLRWEYTYRGHRSDPIITSGTYVGPTGRRHFTTSERDCPLVLFLKPDEPLWGWLGELTETPS